MAGETLVDRLEGLLSSYLQSPGERELFQASELGRALVDSGTRPEQLLSAHVAAMGRILQRLPPAAVAAGALRSYQMLLEALMAYFLAYQPPTPVDGSGTDDASSLTRSTDDRDLLGLEELYQQATDRAAQFRDLVEIGNALVGAARSSDAFERALQRARDLTGAAAGALWLPDAQGHLERRGGEAGEAALLLERLAHQAFDRGQAVVQEHGVAEGAEGNRSELALALPLTPPDGPPAGAFALLIVDGRADQSAQVLDLLRLLASQLGAVIGTTQLQEQLQQNVDALVTLNEIGEALVRTLDPDEVLDLILDGALRFAGVEAATIVPAGEPLSEPGSVNIESGTHVPPSSGAALDEARTTALRSGKAQPVQTLPGPSMAQLWVLPLQAGGRPVGTLEVRLAPADAFPHLPTLLESLAHHGASAIENARRYQAALADQAALQELVSKLISAQEEERRRVAYDIHDGLAQTSAATFQQLQLLAGSYRPRSPLAQSYLDGALHAGQRAVSEAREVIAGLRPTVLDDFGLAAAISREAERLRAEGREVTFEDRIGTARFAPEIETTLYRVAQESLTNIRKHAGPSPVRVTIERVDDVIRLQVRDWGRGFAPDGYGASPTDHVGLAGMRERVTLVRGRFAVAASPEAGTTITAEVPASLT